MDEERLCYQDGQWEGGSEESIVRLMSWKACGDCPSITTFDIRLAEIESVITMACLTQMTLTSKVLCQT